MGIQEDRLAHRLALSQVRRRHKLRLGALSRRVNFLKVLPAELVSRILEFVDAREPESPFSSEDILAVCETSRAFCALARPLIYRHYDMGDQLTADYPFARLALFARTLDESPHLAPLVKSMTVEWWFFNNENIINDNLAGISYSREDDQNYDKTVLWELGAPAFCVLAAHFRYLVQRILRRTWDLRSVEFIITSPMPEVPDDAYWNILDGLDPSLGSLSHVTYSQRDGVDTIIMWRLLQALGRVAPNINQLKLEAYYMATDTASAAASAARSPPLCFPALAHLDVGYSSLDVEPGLTKLLSGCRGLKSFRIGKGREADREKQRESLPAILGLLAPHKDTLMALSLNLGRDRDGEAFLIQPALEPFDGLKALELIAHSEVMKEEAERLAGNYWARRQRYSL
ncbi:hypothetical protein CPLU01_07412 [Colletotrichum plurivorum]|uniref:F-box domain-containing protein n=1 Tax=Colletotrichum plurivorum TaxID=2175906 RepID=A0A8H6NEA2_9PEZI|nr:hypothetical protein CPLU01_07412 [Colletotrichum plurivorum]